MSREQPQPVQRITHTQAAALLGCTTSGVAKFVANGALSTTGRRGPGVGTLDLEQVVRLREERLQAERARRLRYDRVNPQRERPPAELGDHEWLSVEQVAQRLGRTESAVRARAARGTIPHIRAGKRIWIRADHLEVWRQARAVTGPDDLAEHLPLGKACLAPTCSTDRAHSHSLACASTSGRLGSCGRALARSEVGADGTNAAR